MKKAGTEPPLKYGPEYTSWSSKFDHHFHAAMDRMTAAAGIRRQSHQGHEEN